MHKVFPPRSYCKCAKLQRRDGQSQKNAESTMDTKTSPPASRSGRKASIALSVVSLGGGFGLRVWAFPLGLRAPSSP